MFIFKEQTEMYSFFTFSAHVFSKPDLQPPVKHKPLKKGKSFLFNILIFILALYSFFYGNKMVC